MIDAEKKVIMLPLESISGNFLEKLHLSASKFRTDPEITRLREKPLIELYEEKQQIKLFVKIQRSNTSRRGWRRNRYRHTYKKKLAHLKRAIELKLWGVKFAAEREEQIALQNYFLENDP